MEILYNVQVFNSGCKNTHKLGFYYELSVFADKLINEVAIIADKLINELAIIADNLI